MHKVVKLSQIGNMDHWKIVSDTKLTDKEICDIIEQEYPGAGYGPSKFTNLIAVGPKWEVSVWSYSSCD